MTEVLPHGSWPTPITSELVVKASVALGMVALDGDAVWWAERRPEEGGRTQLVRWRAGETADVLPDTANARTAVHEYGGGAWWVSDGRVWFVEWVDQRLYTLDATQGPAGVAPVPLTLEPAVPRGDRWTDGEVSEDGRWLVVVREQHSAEAGVEARNELVVVDTSGELPVRVLVSGPDFVANPRISPDGTQLCWLQWQHPDMPWDGTELVVAGLRWSEVGPGISHPEVVAGAPTAAGQGESVFQPRWDDDCGLWFVSDRNGWWNLYRWTPAGVTPMVEMDAEIGMPQWVFGQSRYALLDDGHVVFAYQRDGLDHLAVRTADGTVDDLDVPYTTIASVQADGNQVVFVGASAVAEPAVVRLHLRLRLDNHGAGVLGEPELLRPPRDLGLEDGWFSVPEALSYPTSGGRTAHALFYPPTNPSAAGPDGELPPLIVFIHGGPTSAARAMLHLGTQYWTSRGFAVVDVNYGGSTGYGRPFRDQLLGQWGIVDLDDCEAAALALVGEGRVDGERLLITGGSAGGYTTLACLAFRDTFAAGASHFGVADLEALAVETHKFESRYLDKLIGPYPEDRDVYIARSPIHHLEGFDRPLAVFQGLDDQVVPPRQSEMIVEALRKRGIPVAYVAFEGEQHGFRQAANIRAALDGELSFYAQVFGFSLPADEGISPIPVENL